MKWPFFRKMGFFPKKPQNGQFRVFRFELFSWKRRFLFFVLNVKRSPFWKKNLPRKCKSPLLILIYIIVAWNFLIGTGKHRNGLPKLNFWTKNNPPFWFQNRVPKHSKKWTKSNLLLSSQLFFDKKWKKSYFSSIFDEIPKKFFFIAWNKQKSKKNFFLVVEKSFCAKKIFFLCL